tara:strand:+ start:1541 stop:2449 length:909 start_codon:yes stop_codon:yes gene_type:complete
MLQSQKNFIFAVLTFLLGVLFLQLMGVIIKFIGSTYPALQLTFFRNLFGIFPIIIFIYISKNLKNKTLLVKIPMLWVAILRGFLMTFAQFCFFSSLFYLQFATANSLTLVTPFMVALFSIPILKVYVGAWKWAAIIIGFSGAYMIISPPSNEVFSIYSLLPLGASFGYGMNLVLVRTFPQSVPTVIIQWYSQLSSIFFTLILVILTFQYVSIQSLNDLIMIILIGFFGAAGVFLMTSSYRMTDHINLGPFHYSAIIFSFFLGWIFFNESPFDELFPGILLIVTAGIIIFWREKIKSYNKNRM